MKNLRVLLLLATVLATGFAANAQFNESNVVITEISYNPPESGNDSLEYVELYNVGTTDVNLNGYTFTQGITYTFGNYTLPAGGYVLVAINPSALQNVFGVTAFQFGGALSNSGETVELRTAASGGTLVDIVTYGTGGAWPSAANGQGASLVLCDPLSDNQLASNWRAATTSIGVTINGRDVRGNPLSNEPCPCPDITTGLTGVITNVACNGGSNGAVNLTVGTGATPFTYVWSNGATTQNISGLSADTYTVTVTDANSCTGTESFTVTQPTALAASNVATNVSCFGGANGSIDATVTGGTTPYTYLWSNGATTQDITGLQFGTYTLTITDANSCTVTTSATITQPASSVSVSNTVTNVSCNGASNGGIDLTVSGGTTPYTYLWSNGATTQDLTNVVASTYSVTVTDGNGCTVVSSATITQPAALTLSSVATNVSCNAGNNGSIDLTVSGNTGPYTYLWSNGATTEDVTGLVANTYTVTVTDANNCTVATSATVTQPTALVLGGVPTHVSCNGGNDGEIDLTVTGGVTPYTYLWSNGATTEDLTGLEAGLYTGTVTDDNGCTAVGSVTVTEPTALAGSVSTINVNCTGGADGSINLTVSGGTTPYIYAWSNAETTEDVVGLVADTYTVTVTDGNGCTVVTSETITEPTAITITGMAADVSCNGGTNGSINVTVSGGATPYTYVWNNAETTEDIMGLMAGTYTVTATDDNGCTATETFTISEGTAIAVVATATDASCLDSLDGEVALAVTGGAAPYTYLWDNAATTATITGIAVGDYTVTITDDNGCEITETATVGFVDSCITTGILPLGNLANGVEVYPNPTTGLVNVTITGAAQASAISVYSLNGSQVLYQTINGTTHGTLSLDVSALTEGIYLLTVQTTDGTLSRTKIVVAKR